MTIKSYKLAGVLAAALALAAPLASADAAPMHGGAMTNSGYGHSVAPQSRNAGFQGRNDGFQDRFHRPAPRNEMRPRMTHRGFHWHMGNWNWRHGHWAWNAGFWNMR